MVAERDHIKVSNHGLLDMNLKYQIVLDTVNLVKNFETEILIPHEGQHASGTYTSRAATLFFLDQIKREWCFEIAIAPKSRQFFFQRKFEVEKRDYTKEFGREIPGLVDKNLKLLIL